MITPLAEPDDRNGETSIPETYIAVMLPLYVLGKRETSFFASHAMEPQEDRTPPIPKAPRSRTKVVVVNPLRFAAVLSPTFRM